MSNYFFKGGRADHMARAFAYIRDRMPLRIADYRQGADHAADYGWPKSPSRLVFSSSDGLIERPLEAVAFDDALPLNTKGLSALGMVECFADATGLNLVGYENRSNQVEPGLLVSVSVFGWPSMDRYGFLQGMLVRSFAADPRYASLHLDLCSCRNGKSFRPQSSAAYCGTHLCVTLLDDGRHDVYDVRFNASLECDENVSSLCVSVSPDVFCAGRIVADLVRCVQDGPDPKWLTADREGAQSESQALQGGLLQPVGRIHSRQPRPLV